MDKNLYLVDIENFRDESQFNIKLDGFQTPWNKSELNYIHSGESREMEARSQFRIDFETHHPDSELSIDFLISTEKDVGFINFYLDNEDDPYDVSDIFNTGIVNNIQSAKLIVPDVGNHFVIVSYERDDFVDEGLDLAEVREIGLYEWMSKEEYDELFELETITETKKEIIPFETEYRNNYELDAGVEEVAQEGINGELLITEEVSLVKGEETDRVVISEEIITQPVTRIVDIGVEPFTPSDDMEHVVTKRITDFTDIELEAWSGTGEPWRTFKDEGKLPLSPSKLRTTGTYTVIVPIETETDNSKIEVGYRHFGNTSSLRIYLNDEDNFIELDSFDNRVSSRIIEFDIPKAGQNEVRIDFIQNADGTTYWETSAFIDWINIFSLVEIPNEIEMIKDVPLGSKITMDLYPNQDMIDNVVWTVVSHEHDKKNSQYPEEDKTPTYATTLLSDDIISLREYRDNSAGIHLGVIGNSLSSFYENIPNNIKGVTLESRKSFIPTGYGAGQGGDDKTGIGGGLVNLFIPTYGELGGDIRRIEDPRGMNVWFYFRRGTRFDYQGDMLSMNPSSEEFIDKYNERQDLAHNQKEYGDFIPYFTREMSRASYVHSEYYTTIYGIGREKDIKWGFYTPESGYGWAGIRPAMYIDHKAKVELVEDGVYKIVEEFVDDGTAYPVEVKEVEEFEDIDYRVLEREEPAMDVGDFRVIQEGIKGLRTKTYRVVVYSDGSENRMLIETVTSPPRNEIVLIGTKRPEEDKELPPEVEDVLDDIEGGNKYKTETVIEEEEETIPFETEYINNYYLEEGEQVVKVEGQEGKLLKRTLVTYVDGVRQGDPLEISPIVVSNPITRVIEIGVGVIEPTDEEEYVLTDRTTSISNLEIDNWTVSGSWKTVNESGRLPLKPTNPLLKRKNIIEIPINTPTDNTKVELGYFYSDSYFIDGSHQQGIYSNFNIYVNDDEIPLSLDGNSTSLARTAEVFVPNKGRNTIKIEFDQYHPDGGSGTVNVSIEWIHVFGVFNKLNNEIRVKDLPVGSKIIMDANPNNKGLDEISWILADHSRIENNNRYPDTNQYPSYATTLLSNDIVSVASWRDYISMDNTEFHNTRFNETSIGQALINFENMIPNYIYGKLIEHKTSILPDAPANGKLPDGYFSGWMKSTIPALGEMSGQRTLGQFRLLQREFVGSGVSTSSSIPTNEIIDDYNQLIANDPDSTQAEKEYGESIRYFTREASQNINLYGEVTTGIIMLDNNSGEGSVFTLPNGNAIAGIRPLINIEPDTIVVSKGDGVYRFVNSDSYDDFNPIVKVEEREEFEEIPFNTIEIDEPTMAVGLSIILSNGKNGIDKKVYEIVTYRDGTVEEFLVRTETTELPESRVILVGTKKPEGGEPPKTTVRVWLDPPQIMPIQDKYRNTSALHIGQIVRRYSPTEPREGLRSQRWVSMTTIDGREFVYPDGHYVYVYPVHRWYDVGTRKTGSIDWVPPIEKEGNDPSYYNKKKSFLNNYIYLLDKDNFEIEEIIDNYESFSMTINYKSVGEFVLQLDNRIDSAKELYKDRIIQYGRSHRFVGIITRVQLSVDEEGNEIRTVEGRTIGDLLSRRVVWMPTDRSHRVMRYEGKSETIIKDVITDNIINPEDPDRKISNFRVKESKELGRDMFREFVFNNIEEVTEDLVSEENFGWEVYLDEDNGELVFDILEGNNYSVSQDENPHVLFSDRLGNIESQEFLDDESNHKNYLYLEYYSSLWSNTPSDWTLMGEEGVSGIDRREGYTKADIYMPERIPPDSLQLSVPPEEIGGWYLADKSPIQNFDAKVIDGQVFTYGEHYDIGDIVSIENKDWGIEVDLRIISVTVESSGEGMDFDIYLTFGDKIPRLTDKVKYEIENYDETANTSKKPVTSHELAQVTSTIPTEQRIREIIRQETSGGGGWG